MTAIPGSAGRASRRQAVRLFGGCVRGLLAGLVLAGCGSGGSGEGGGAGFSGVLDGAVFSARAVGGVLV